MWEPVGPLPAAVYWRRRCSAALATVAVLGLLTWSRRRPRRPGSGAPPPARPAAPQSPLPSPPPRPRRQPRHLRQRRGRGPRRSRSGAAAPRPTRDRRRPAAATAERLQPDDSPRASLPAPPPIPVPATGPVPCSDDMIGVAAEIDPAEHRVGPAADAAAGRDQHQRAALRARPRPGPPGDRGLEPGRGPALVEQRLRQRLRGRSAHAGARAAGGVRGGLGRPHLGARLRGHPRASCRPATTGC